MSDYPEVMSCSDLGRVLALNDPPPGAGGGVRQRAGVRGKGGIEIKHSTDFESLPSHPRVYMGIPPEG